jgi:hypothetical protein
MVVVYLFIYIIVCVYMSRANLEMFIVRILLDSKIKILNWVACGWLIWIIHKIKKKRKRIHISYTITLDHIFPVFTPETCTVICNQVKHVGAFHFIFGPEPRIITKHKLDE